MLSYTTELDPSTKDTVEDEEAANDLILVQFPPVPDASSPSAPELKLSAVLAVGVAFRLL